MQNAIQCWPPRMLSCTLKRNKSNTLISMHNYQLLVDSENGFNASCTHSRRTFTVSGTVSVWLPLGVIVAVAELASARMEQVH
jgi:hypothetical protein